MESSTSRTSATAWSPEVPAGDAGGEIDGTLASVRIKSVR